MLTIFLEVMAEQKAVANVSKARKRVFMLGPAKTGAVLAGS
jgi:hypothetical protein